jgi:LmbE family N-acetylglucosaminyl deacetylase
MEPEKMKKTKVLVVAAHPDDEILGCGGTVARLSAQGHEVSTLILGEGITSRDGLSDAQKTKKALESLKKDARKANKIIGSKDVFFGGFPDNRFDSVPLLEIVKYIENIKNRLRPSIMFTHYENDLNIDHRITYLASITATRPLPQEPVKSLYSFEVLSSTEWSYPLKFSPDVFFDIEEYIGKKISALKEYKTEVRSYPHPRSITGVKLNAQYRGMSVGLKFAEAFKTVRDVR